MTIDIAKPLDTELARTLPGYIRETRAALEGAVTDSSAALNAVGILEDEVADLAALISAALVKFPNQAVLPDGDATPSVSGGIIYRTANSTSTAITYLDGGFAGQMVIIVADDENTSVVHNPGYILLEGGATISFNANQGIILVCHENSIGNKQWVQVGGIGGGSSTGNAKFNRDVFTVGAGGQSSFDTSVSFQPGEKLMFPYVNGELQPSTKFTEVDSNTITFVETLPEGTFVELVYITTLSVSTSVDDLFVVNKPYIDARQYNSFVEANTAASLQNKLLVISTSLPVEANGTFASDILLLPGGAIEIAAGFNTVFSGTVTLEANSEIDSATGSLEFSGGAVCKGGTINATGAISITGPFTCSLSRCFTGSGVVTFGAGSVTEVFPEWWGTVDYTTINTALIAHKNVTISSNITLTGTILIPSARTLAVKPNVILTASGGCAGSYMCTNSEAVAGNSCICIYGGVWDGDNIAGAIHLSKCTDSTVSNTTVKNTKILPYTGTDAAILIDNSSIRVTVRGCILSNSIDHGIAAYASEQVTIDGNTLDTCLDSSITVVDSSLSIVTNNNISGSQGSHVSYNSTHGVVANNIISAGATATYGYGITLGHLSHSASYTSVTGNTIIGHTNAGIYLQNADSTTVSGNTIYGDGSTGIGISIASESSSVSGNSIYNCYRGIVAYEASVRCGSCIIGNTISNSKSYGIYSVTGNHVISGNRVINSGKGGSEGVGIELASSSTNCTVTGNRCFDNQSPKTQVYGINTAKAGNIIVANSVAGNNNFGIRSTVADNVIKDNLTDKDTYNYKINKILDNTGTPSVLGCDVCSTGGTADITRFLGGSPTQQIMVIGKHSVNIVHNAAYIYLNGAANFAMTVNDTLTLICDEDRRWREVGRSVV